MAFLHENWCVRLERSRVSPENVRDRLDQRMDSGAGFGTHGHRMSSAELLARSFELLRSWRNDVRFRPDGNDRRVRARRESDIECLERLDALEAREDDGGARDIGCADLNADSLDDIRRLAHAGGVDEAKRERRRVDY